ncbi:MAG: PDZ domain-containing protein, partial [Gemmatimonadetes bacterium]|nr:PDZ domain-containing protein [Gemmatimonadota bacterium]
VWGDPFLEERDLGGGGWSTAYASTRTSEEADTEGEIIGGKLIVYAPDDQQAFPSGFGSDGLLFTEDDPEVILPQGYTLVDLDSDPFTFDRSREITVDLIEPEGTALDDFSEMSYSEAFDAMLEKMRTEYAFSEYKSIDWDALAEVYRPRFVEAERQGPDAYLIALRDFLAEIPDGHVSGPFVLSDFQQNVGGGLGLAVRELDDGRIVVVTVIPGSPGAEAGVELGAEILSVNGRDITTVVDETRPWLGPFSTDHNRRLDQLRFALRFPVGTEVELAFANPGAEAETVELAAVQEVDSLLAVWPGANLTGFELPVEYEVLPNGVVYASINSFFDTDVLTILLWERLMKTLNDNEVPGLILDLRQNGGGRGFLADQM